MSRGRLNAPGVPPERSPREASQNYVGAFWAAVAVSVVVAVAAVLLSIHIWRWTDGTVHVAYRGVRDPEARSVALLKARQDARTLLLSGAGAVIAYLSWLTTYYLKSRETQLAHAREHREAFSAISKDLGSQEMVNRLGAIGALRAMCYEPVMKGSSLLREQCRAYASALLVDSAGKAFVPSPQSYDIDAPLVEADIAAAFLALARLHDLDGRQAQLMGLKVGERQLPFIEGCVVIDGLLRRVWLHRFARSRMSRVTLESVELHHIVDAEFFGCRFIQCNWKGARLERARFQSCSFHMPADGSAFEGGTVFGLTWRELAGFNGVSFQKCDINGRDFADGTLTITDDKIGIDTGSGIVDLGLLLQPRVSRRPPRIKRDASEDGAADD